MNTESFAPERLFVVRKPFGPNISGADEQVEQLRDEGWRVDVLDTLADYEATEDLYLNQVRDGDLTLVVGGDGSGNRAYRMQQNLKPSERRILPIGGGNARDWRWMLNKDVPAAEILRAGQYCAAYALRATIEQPDGAFTDLPAVAYAGIGATARASHWINNTKVTSNRFTRAIGLQQGVEAVTALLGVGLSPRLTLMSSVEGAPRRRVKDVSAFNGDRVAIHGRPHGHILRPSYEHLESKPVGIPGALKDMIKMKMGIADGTITSEPTTFTVQTRRRMFPIHVDGEVVWADADSRVTLGVDPDPYFTYTTRMDLLETA